MFTSRFSGVSDRNIMNSKKSFVIGNEVKYPGNVHVDVHEIFHNLSLDGKTSESFLQVNLVLLERSIVLLLKPNPEVLASNFQPPGGR